MSRFDSHMASLRLAEHQSRPASTQRAGIALTFVTRLLRTGSWVRLTDCGRVARLGLGCAVVWRAGGVGGEADGQGEGEGDEGGGFHGGGGFRLVFWLIDQGAFGGGFGLR